MKQTTVIGISIILSLLLDAVISAVIALGISIFSAGEISFIAIFLISFGVVFIIGNLFNVYLISKDNLKNRELKAIENATKAAQEIEIECATCHSRNIIKVLLNENNSFVCSKCNQENNIYMNFTTVQKTIPLVPVMDIKSLPHE